MKCTKCKERIERGQKYHRTKRGSHHVDCTAWAPPFVAWRCEKCGRYHDRHFPDVGCDWCSGSAISKRLGLSPQDADLRQEEAGICHEHGGVS